MLGNTCGICPPIKCSHAPIKIIHIASPLLIVFNFPKYHRNMGEEGVVDLPPPPTNPSLRQSVLGFSQHNRCADNDAGREGGLHKSERESEREAVNSLLALSEKMCSYWLHQTYNEEHWNSTLKEKYSTFTCCRNSENGSFCA